MKKLDLGNSDFKSIIENNYYFVDKSLFIHEIIEIQKQVILLPRPRRFGKTLNLSMLRYFFDINQAENKNLFTQLNIWQTNDTTIEEHFAKYPVIYISFKDAKEKTWHKCLELIKAEISDLYASHNYLTEGSTLSEHELDIFSNIKNGIAKETDYQRSLKKLSEYLHRYYNQRIVVLIDEYDTPIQAGHKNYYDDVISFMRNLMTGVLKDNSYLYKGVITGILRVSKESIFTGLNNVSVYSILEDEFSDKFGFTEKEVMQILLDFNVSTDYEQIKVWYDGYKFGDTTNIYNPWSILNYSLSSAKGFRPFWVNTSSDDLIRERLSERNADYIREQLLTLINNGTIDRKIDENFIFPDLKSNKELLWTLLVFSGYLTVLNQTGRKIYTIAIPNYEIKTIFQDIIIDWLSTDVKIMQNLLLETTQHLINNEIEKFEKGFKEIMGDTFSYFDVKGEPENVYQSYVLGLLAIIGDDYIIKSNRESGEGRYDIMLVPHDKNKYGVVIEIKQIAKVDNETEDCLSERITSKINEALTQIEQNRYYKELIDHKIKKIIKLPIVFVGKEPHITHKSIKK